MNCEKCAATCDEMKKAITQAVFKSIPGAKPCKNFSPEGVVRVTEEERKPKTIKDICVHCGKTVYLTTSGFWAHYSQPFSVEKYCKSALEKGSSVLAIPAQGAVVTYEESPGIPPQHCGNCGLPLKVNWETGEYVHKFSDNRFCPNMLGRNWKAFQTEAWPVSGCAVIYHEEPV